MHSATLDFKVESSVMKVLFSNNDAQVFLTNLGAEYFAGLSKYFVGLSYKDNRKMVQCNHTLGNYDPRWTNIEVFYCLIASPYIHYGNHTNILRMSPG